MKRIGKLAAASIIGGTIALTGCAGHHHAATPTITNSTVRADVQAVENQLAACARKQHTVSKAALHATMQCAFPKGEVPKIEAYALRHVTPHLLVSKTARDAWYQAVAEYALSLGSPSPSPSASTS